jgi:hypothetical protein
MKSSLKRILGGGFGIMMSCASGFAAEPAEPTLATIDYAGLAFQPKTWKERGMDTQMTVWPGKEIVFLVQPGSYEPELMKKWVGRLDQGWALYRELTGRSPRLFKQVANQPMIAAVPAGGFTCGAGCGYVGSTGIELAMFHSDNYQALKADPDAMPHYVYYEMGRNYYTFGERHSCFTTGFAVFMRYVCMDTIGCKDTDSATRRTIESLEPLFKKRKLDFIELFTNSAGVGEKGNRIKDDQGRTISPSDQPCTYASAMMRLHRECGGNDWLKRFFVQLALCAEVKPISPEAARTQCWNWMLCASLAAQRDLSSIFADDWGLPIHAETRSQLAKVDWKDASLDVTKLSGAVTPRWK